MSSLTSNSTRYEELKRRLRPALLIIDRVEEMGGRAYVAGGAVRDFVLGKPISSINDIDLTVFINMTKEELYDELKRGLSGKCSLKKGGNPLTLKAVCGNEDLDIVLARSDWFDTSVVQVGIQLGVPTLKDDAATRDFTINALYLNKELKVLDPLRGLEDIRAKVLRLASLPGREYVKLEKNPSIYGTLFKNVAKFPHFSVDWKTLAVFASAAYRALPKVKKRKVVSKLVKGAVKEPHRVMEVLSLLAEMDRTGTVRETLAGDLRYALRTVQAMTAVESKACRAAVFLAWLGGWPNRGISEAVARVLKSGEDGYEAFLDDIAEVLEVPEQEIINCARKL